MSEKTIKHTFPVVVAFYILMLIAYTLSATTFIMSFVFPSWNFDYVAEIPFDVIGWFFMAIASLYCGGTAMLNIFTSRNLHELDNVEASGIKLKKILVMSYFACIYCFALTFIGISVPLESMIATVGTCTILIVASKKGSQSAVEAATYDEEHDHEVEELELENKKLQAEIAKQKLELSKNES